MSQVEIIKNGRKLGTIDEVAGTVEISEAWRKQRRKKGQKAQDDSQQKDETTQDE